MKVLHMHTPDTCNILTAEELERIARQLIARQLDAGKDAARDSIVNELIRKQGIESENAETQIREMANQAEMKIFMSCNFSGKGRPLEGFWR